MASITTNLSLTKPEASDNITPTIFADNFDKIDTAVAGRVPMSGGTMSGPLVAYNTADTNIRVRNSVVFASGSTTTRASTFQLNYYRK